MSKRTLWTATAIVAVLLLATAMFLPGAAAAQGPNNVVLTVNDHLGSPLPGVSVYYNDYGNHWVLLGNTTSSNPVMASFADGTYNFKAVKDYSEQATSVVVSGSGGYTFQTNQFVVNVDDSNGNDFPGIAVDYNDYGNHYLSMGVTDGNGNAYIELFPGTYTFRASKDYSTASGQTNGSIGFQAAKFTVNVDDSSGADFPGIAVSYNDYGNHYLSMGTTDGSGNASIELFPGSFTFRASKDQTDVTGVLANNSAGTTTTISFQTAKAVAIVRECGGTPLAGFNVAFNDYGNHWLSMGATGVDGKASIELFPGTRKFRALIDYTSEAKDLNLALTSSTVEFYPTKVNWQYGGTIQYNDYGNHWKTMSSPFYMFPGTYKFRFNGVEQTIPISGCEMSSSILLINLKNSSGAGVSGGNAYLGVGGWPAIGTTDANGNLVYFHNGTLGNLKVQMTAPNCGGSQESPVQDTTVNSVFNFQTSQVVIQLKDSAGTLTDGGVVAAGCGGWPVIGASGDNGAGTLYHEHFAGTFKYRMSYHGSSLEIQQDVSNPFIFQTVKAIVRLEDHTGAPLNGGKVLQGIGGWPQIGTTGDSAPGEVWYELFPGTHSFRMSYNYGTEEKSQDISTPVVFQTALVKLQFSGAIKHKVGGWPAYAGPTEMLPVSHGFGFTGCGYPQQEVYFTPAAGTVFERSMVFASLKNSGGAGLAGGAAEYRNGSWTAMGSTGANGLLVYGIPGIMTNLRFAMNYNSGRQETGWQNVASNSCVNFQTANVTMQLLDSGNNPIVGTNAQYRPNGSWMTFGSGTTTTSMELLPVSYRFRLSYAGATKETGWTAIVPGPNTVTFQTANVTVQLLDSSNGALTGTNVEYRPNGSWQTFGSGTTTTSMELLPVSYRFRLSYAGATQETGWTAIVPGNNTVTFQTELVAMQLLDSNNLALTGTAAQYRPNGSWMQFGTGSTPATMQLLPVSYRFRVSYAGATKETGWIPVVSGGPNTITFQTELVTMQLVASDGVTVLAGTNPQYRPNGSWMTFGSGPTTTSMELLPVSYRFRVSYNGGTKESGWIPVVSGGPNTVQFQTGQVTSGTCTQYRHNGVWLGFSSPMELLPVSTRFRDVDGPDTGWITPAAGITTPVVCN